MQKKVPKLQMEDVLWVKNKKGNTYMQHCKNHLKWAHFDGGHWVVEIECQQHANVLPTFVAIKIVWRWNLIDMGFTQMKICVPL